LEELKEDTILPKPTKLDTAVTQSAPTPEVRTRDSSEIMDESRERVKLMINEYQNRCGMPESHSLDGLFAPVYYPREGCAEEDHAPQGQEKPQRIERNPRDHDAEYHKSAKEAGKMAVDSESAEEDWDLVSVRSDASVAVTDCWAVEENGSQIGNWQHVSQTC
jgi:hypothetical protein